VRRLSLSRWAPVSGIAFVALWGAGFGLLIANEPGDSDAEILSFYADAGNQGRAQMASFLMVIAGLFFLWFLTVLRGRLARAEGQAGPHTALAFGAGLVASALWLVASVFWMAIGYTIQETATFTLDPNMSRLVNEMAYLTWVFGTVVALLIVLVTSLLGLKTGVVPRWLAWIGLIVAVAMLLTALFVGFLIFLGWVLAVSIVFLVRTEEQAADAHPAREVRAT